MTKAIIYKPSKSAMTSGRGKTKNWVLEYIKAEKKTVDNLMGWQGSGDMNQEVKLKFKTKEEAIEFAQSKDLQFEVREPKERKIKIQSYADNFTG
jgi:NADH dehydrogenase